MRGFLIVIFVAVLEGINCNYDIMTMPIMTLLITTLPIMTILITLKIGDIIYSCYIELI
jgi:hypothetical protein